MAEKKGKHLQKRNLNTKFIIICIALLLAIIGTILCIISLANKNKTPEPEPDVPEEVTPAPQPAPQPEKTAEPEPEPDSEPEFINPLTGLPTEEDISGRRPYAVMFNNIKVATPQKGISKADIIYETLVEGGITRMIGIFQDIGVTDILGSVRSARPYFLDIAQGHDAIYIHAGGSPDAYIQIRNRGVDNIDGVTTAGEVFFRDSWRRNNMGYEHSLMLDTSLVSEYVKSRDIRTEHETGYAYDMSFSDTPRPRGQKAEDISVTFSSGKHTDFSYDAGSKEYKVSQYGREMTDSADDTQVSVKNVLVIYAPMGRISGDDAGRLYADFTGTGTGYFACEGSVTPIKWSKEDFTSQFTYTLENGKELEFGRGMSFICIIPTSDGEVEFS